MFQFIHISFQVKYLGPKLLLDVESHIELRFKHHDFIFELRIFALQIVLLGLLCLQSLFDFAYHLLHIGSFSISLHQHLFTMLIFVVYLLYILASSL